MPQLTPVPLTPVGISLGSEEFEAICGWPYQDRFVARLLDSDVTQRMQFGDCRAWIYRDPSGQLAGFGTLDLCHDYAEFTGDQPHPYIPLLATNPRVPTLGYGTSILRHLIEEAAIMAYPCDGCHHILFLDAYTASNRAIALYERHGFEIVSPRPITDPLENNACYIVMAKNVRVN